MPRHPAFAPAVRGMKGSPFSSLGRKLAAASQTDAFYPLHVGDTWMEPAPGARMQDLDVTEFPGLHRYAPPQGWPPLLDALVERARVDEGLAVERDQILVSAGATGGLAAVIGATLAPGEELLVLGPHWPLIVGITRAFRGEPVVVPFIGVVDGPEAVAEQLDRFRSRRTVGLYVSSPNNPTGRVLSRATLEALAEWARREDLWLFSDEVYERYVYRGEHVPVRPLAPERTFSVRSFSKAYGMAGNRCGYVVGPARAMAEARKIVTHTFYCAPRAAQVAALRVLGDAGDAWVAHARERYGELGRAAASRLGVEPPEGSTFLFLDVAPHLDERGLGGFLGDAADRGLFLAPGPSFGPYGTSVRICYTCATPEIVRRGVDVLANLIGS